jgi:NADPH-dependent curcumin reductase CurA
MQSGAVGEVVGLRHPAFQTGDIVTGLWGWRDSLAALPARFKASIKAFQ